MKTLTLSANWKLSGGPWRHYEETIAARYTEAYYLKCLWVPEYLEFRHCENEQDARLSIARLKRIIAFMDVSELRPVQHLFKLFPGAKGLPSYADHTLVWQDHDKRYLITTEPYGMPKSLDAPPGWRVLALPPGYGLWTAPISAGNAQTEFIWLSPLNNGLDLEVLAQKLMSALDHRRQQPLSASH